MRTSAGVVVSKDTTETGLVALVGCPGCGAESPLNTADRAFRCPFCQSSHLVVRKTKRPAFEVPSRIADERDALAAFVDDEKRRREIRLAGPAGPGPDRAMESVTAAAVEAWGVKLLTETTLEAAHRFWAPYWHLAGRYYEALVTTNGVGSKEIRVAMRPVELVAPAFAAGLPLPAMGRLSYGMKLKPMTRRPAASLASGESTDIDVSASRLEKLEVIPDTPRLARDARLWAEDYALVYRPFWLLTVLCRRKRLQLLMDGGSRSLAGVLSDPEAATLAGAIRKDRTSFGEPFAFRPMRCPECGNAFPLERQEEVRFCATCGHAFRIEGERLARVAYRMEPPPRSPRGTVLLPFWRFRFRLTDPADGAVTTTLGEISDRIGADAGEDAAIDLVDVPAFFTRRISNVSQELFVASREAAPLIEGPVRTEMGYPGKTRGATLLEPEGEFLARYALALRVGALGLGRAGAVRLRRFLFDAPLHLTARGLVLRVFRVGELAP